MLMLILPCSANSIKYSRSISQLCLNVARPCQCEPSKFRSPWSTRTRTLFVLSDISGFPIMQLGLLAQLLHQVYFLAWVGILFHIHSVPDDKSIRTYKKFPPLWAWNFVKLWRSKITCPCFFLLKVFAGSSLVNQKLITYYRYSRKDKP